MTRHVFDIIVQVALCMQSFSQEWQSSIKISTGEVIAVCSGDISLKVCQVLTMKEEVTTTCQSLQRQTSHGHLPVQESSDVKQASSYGTQMASCQMCARLSRLLAGTVLGSTVRDVTVPLLLMHLHISHLLNSLNSSLPSTSVPRSILPTERKKHHF